jgi:23S rRNA pseudouridine2605 synthase
LVFHKPGGVITTLKDPEGRESITDFIPHFVPRVYPVGRLDWDTQGVLILTNDGELANRLMHPSREIPKVYRVKVQGLPPDVILQQLADGVEIDVDRTDGKTGRTTTERVMTAPVQELVVLQEKAGKTWIRLVIHEGRNRQVRRMCEAVGHPVRRLVRTRIGPLVDRSLKPGQWRNLTADEWRALTEAVADASTDTLETRE